MAEVILITKADFDGEIGLTQNIVNDKILLPFIKQAQRFDLKNRLGAAFYQDVMTNSLTYTAILDGVTYTNSTPETIHFNGVRAALCHYTYARYILESNAVNTPFGTRQKSNEVSEPVSDKMLAQIAANHFNIAESLMNDVERYLNDPTIINTYPIWRNSGLSECESARSGRTKLFKVSKV